MILQTAKIRVKSNNSVYVATCLFDTGVDRSYISSEFAALVKPTIIFQILVLKAQRLQIIFCLNYIS